MRFAEIDRRLRRIEAGRSETVPTCVMADRPLEPGEASEALADWRDWVAEGRAERQGPCLFITSLDLTPEEWAARYVTAH